MNNRREFLQKLGIGAAGVALVGASVFAEPAKVSLESPKAAAPKAEAPKAEAPKAETVNGNDFLIPEMWAHESLTILEENMCIGGLVHRDFHNEVQCVPPKRHVPVPPTQHFYASMPVRDSERDKLRRKELVDTHLEPAMRSMASAIDRIILGKVRHGQS